MLAMRNLLSPNTEKINRYNSLILADRNAFCIRKPGVKSRNLWSKPEVVLAAILEAEGSKLCENASKRRQKAIITDASMTA